MRAYLFTSILLCAFILSGCTGSGITPLVLSDIHGPKIVSEQASVQYSVDASGDRDLEFEWTIKPGTVGFLTDKTTKIPTLHTYEINGNIDAVLTLVVDTVKYGPVVKSIDIRVVDSNQPPTAQATADHERIGDGQYVQFTDESTDPDSDIYNYEWDFSYEVTTGFQPESLEQNPNWQFMNAGLYDVQLRVTDYAGHTDMLDEPITIEVVINTAPVAEGINRDLTTIRTGATFMTLFTPNWSDQLPYDDVPSFLWEASAGDYAQFDTYKASLLWYPPDYPCIVAISFRVTDLFGLYDDASTLMWVTTMPVLDNPNANANFIISRQLDTAFSGTIDPKIFQYPYVQPNGQVVLMAFWASWSSGSVADMPALTNIYNQHIDDEFLLACVNQGESKLDVIDFVNLHSYEADYWFLDPDASYFEESNDWAGDASSIPIYLLFDRDGRCRWSHAGALGSTAAHEAAIDELL